MLGLATTQATRFLIRLYCRLLGEIKKLDDGKTAVYSRKHAEHKLQTVRLMLELLGADTDLGLLRPVQHWPKDGPLERSDIRRGILRTLRRANDWLTYQELAGAILLHHAVTGLTDAQRKKFVQRVREAMHVLAARGHVECERSYDSMAPGETQRWRLRNR